ncbi:DHH family protein [Xylariales sp. PMI_506]|nr:DHH family protein [Xylariales sp. PMI_506]
MKRSASATTESQGSRAKKPRQESIPYHLTPSRRDSSGEIIWPAPQHQINKARELILECAASGQKTLIVPDKDADGLASGAIVRTTLILLGLDPALIAVHLVQKSNNIHDESERISMTEHGAAYIFVLDQGSRKSGPVVNNAHKALVIDHHHALEDDFPEGAYYVTACNSPPVATTSLLAYNICTSLHDQVEVMCGWLCVLGTCGDLGNSVKWQPPFPDMATTFAKHSKSNITKAVPLINAPRRTASYDVPGAWTTLIAARSPTDLLKNNVLNTARVEVSAEVERCTHTAPLFSADGKVAVFRISSGAQVHNVIATRWAGHLRSQRLEVILVANEGYRPGMVNFSCRIARCALDRDPPINIIEMLRDIADRAPDPTLRERLGESFARGHKEASGGIVPKAEFEELMNILEVGRRSAASSPTKKKDSKSMPQQANTLMNYFSKS